MCRIEPSAQSQPEARGNASHPFIRPIHSGRLTYCSFPISTMQHQINIDAVVCNEYTSPHHKDAGRSWVNSPLRVCAAESGKTLSRVIGVSGHNNVVGDSSCPVSVDARITTATWLTVERPMCRS